MAGSSTTDLWVFGYGSLMWRPGFAFEEACRARLAGFHRALCVWSLEYRGTSDWPGLVFGLDRGGACDGLAFRVAPEFRSQVLEYLYDRELVTGVYTASWHPVEVRRTTGFAHVRALAFVVERRHRQYAPPMPLAIQAAVVRAGRGRTGRNLDYVISTARHLAELGIRDRPIERLVSLIGPQHLREGSCCTTELPADGRRSRASASRPRSAEMRLGPRLPPPRVLRISYRRRIEPR